MNQDFDVYFQKLLDITGSKTDAALAGYLGYSPQSVYNAKLRKSIPNKWIKKISKDFNIPESQLQYQIIFTHNVAPINDCDITFINMRSALASAGYGSDANEEEIIGQRAFLTSWIKQKGDPQNMDLIVVSGDSMSPEIQDKDLILIDRSKIDIYPSQIYAVGFEDNIYVKRIEKLPNCMLLKSDNPNYEPIPIQANEYTLDQFRIIGRVLWVCREY